MIIDGRKIAADIVSICTEKYAQKIVKPTLTIISVAPNPATRSFLGIKMRTAEKIGLEVVLVTLDENTTIAQCIEAVRAVTTSACIVQLPLPAPIDTDAVLAAITPEKDVDALNPATTQFLPPVARACAHILAQENIDPCGMRVVVLGEGRLVGKPCAQWLQKVGARVTVLTEKDTDIAIHIKTADIIVCGTGVAGILTPSMIQEGVIILDAGASEQHGKIVGDANLACVEKAKIFTPVPGGIGPVTVAALFENILLD